MEADVESRIEVLRRRGGERRPATSRGDVESTLGADVSAVRRHRDAPANALSQEFGARAFTLGSDMYFGDPAMDLDPGAGRQILAAELTDTVQQSARSSAAPTGDRPIRRDIGFEFETQQMATRKSTTGHPPQAGFANNPAGNAAATAMFNSAQRLKKGAVLLSRPDIEVQADDGPLGSDLEVVVNHLPETQAGRQRLDAAMTDLLSLVARYSPLAVGGVVPAAALHGFDGFRSEMRDGLIWGDWGTATTGPQVTMGVRVRNVPNLVRDLHDAPGESPAEKTTRDPGRLHMRAKDLNNPAQPKRLRWGTEAHTLVSAHGLAQGAIVKYQQRYPTAPGGPSLTGFLTIIYSYVRSMRHKGSFLKSHTPLMAKTDLATVWRTLPQRVRDYYRQVDNNGRSRFEKLVKQAPGYGPKMNRPLFERVKGLSDDDQPTDQWQWYHNLTLEDWLRSIIVDRNPTVPEAFRDFVRGTPKSRGTDMLTNKHFPGRPANREVEGYGALGSRTDAHGNEKLPVFELRSATKLMEYGAAHQWALDMFDYITSMNRHPKGAYQHMV